MPKNTWLAVGEVGKIIAALRDREFADVLSRSDAAENLLLLETWFDIGMYFLCGLHEESSTTLKWLKHMRDHFGVVLILEVLRI